MPFSKATVMSVPVGVPGGGSACASDLPGVIHAIPGPAGAMGTWKKQNARRPAIPLSVLEPVLSASMRSIGLLRTQQHGINSEDAGDGLGTGAVALGE